MKLNTLCKLLLRSALECSSQRSHCDQQYLGQNFSKWIVNCVHFHIVYIHGIVFNDDLPRKLLDIQVRHDSLCAKLGSL